MSRPMQVRLCDEDMAVLKREIQRAKCRPTERPGLYIMVFLCLMGSCSGWHRSGGKPETAETAEVSE